MLLLLNKPYGVLSQFSGVDREATLAAYIDQPGVYAAGRLDRDSEGLLMLTDDGRLQARLADPRHKLPKTYCVQVEGEMTAEAAAALEAGVELKDGKTRPAKVRLVPEPAWLWPRNPPVRFRKEIPTYYILIRL